MQDNPGKNLRNCPAVNRQNPETVSIPNKLYFNIGEVAKLCDLKPHVLRFWEQEFFQLQPVKRKGNRRFYQRKDVLLVVKIKDLLYLQGFTIEGARSQLQQSTVKPQGTLAKLRNLLTELEGIVTELQPTGA
ncbi:MAG: MerR family transcriptional regulator [Gammaproteobacteria bacterium]